MAEKQSLTKRFTEGLLQASKRLSKTERRLLPGLDREGHVSVYVDTEAHNWIVSLLVARDSRRLSDIYRQHLSRLVELCVEQSRQEEFYYALDEMNQRSEEHTSELQSQR